MSQKFNRRLRLIYGIILSVLIVTVGICLVVSCVAIYKSGDRPFSADSVAARFAVIAVPCYVTVAALLGGALITCIFPVNAEPVKGQVPQKKQLARLYRRFDEKSCAASVKKRITFLKRSRIVTTAVAATICTVCAVLTAIYLFTPENFTMEGYNHEIFTAIWYVSGVFSALTLLCFGVSLWNESSIAKEIALVKQELASGASLAKPREETDAEKGWHCHGKGLVKVFVTEAAILASVLVLSIVMYCNGFLTSGALSALTYCAVALIVVTAYPITVYFLNFRNRPTLFQKCQIRVVQIVLLIVAVILIVVGINNGGMRDVLQKAIRICTECIGLG